MFNLGMYRHFTKSQLRAALELLKWRPQAEVLAARSGVKIGTLNKYLAAEGPERLGPANQAKIAKTMTLAGIEFLDTGGVQPKPVLTVLEGDDVNNLVLDDIYYSLKDTGGEVLICGLSEIPPEDERYADVKAHVERLQDAGITERILIEKGDTNLIAPTEWYRSLPQNNFNNAPYQIYGNKIALKNWGPPQRIIVIEDEQLAVTMRTTFNYLWDEAAPVRRRRS